MWIFTVTLVSDCAASTWLIYVYKIHIFIQWTSFLLQSSNCLPLKLIWLRRPDLKFWFWFNLNNSETKWLSIKPLVTIWFTGKTMSGCGDDRNIYIDCIKRNGIDHSIILMNVWSNNNTLNRSKNNKTIHIAVNWNCAGCVSCWQIPFFRPDSIAKHKRTRLFLTHKSEWQWQTFRWDVHERQGLLKVAYISQWRIKWQYLLVALLFCSCGILI